MIKNQWTIVCGRFFFQKVGLLGLALLYWFSGITQTNILEEVLREQFPNPEGIEWLRYYKGRLDDFNDIAVVLASDGYLCKGELTYLRSQTTFQLDGKMKGKEFELKEVDINGKVSGYLEGKISNNILRAEWRNVDETVGGEILLMETQRTDDFPLHCGDNKWINIYEGTGSGTTVTLILQKEANNQIWGMAYLNGKGYTVKGEINMRNDLDVVLRQFNGKPLGRLKGNFRNHRNFKVTLLDDSEKQKMFAFRLKEQLQIGCVDYADYTSSFEITYPKSKNAAFNEWMKNTANAWVENCRSKVKKVNLENPSPKNRGLERGSAWCDIEFYNEQIMSGFMTFSSTWSRNKEGIAFNFDLENGTLLMAEDIFKDHFDQPHFLKNVVRAVFKNHPNYGEEGFKNWINTVSFPHFIIRQDGINFSTDFSVLYGRQSVTIPFEELRAFLKEDSMVARFLN